jgi:hypothetical protein
MTPIPEHLGGGRLRVLYAQHTINAIRWLCEERVTPETPSVSSVATTDTLEE